MNGDHDTLPSSLVWNAHKDKGGSPNPADLNVGVFPVRPVMTVFDSLWNQRDGDAKFGASLGFECERTVTLSFVQSEERSTEKVRFARM